MTDFDDTIERLEAEVKASGADPADLGIVDKSEYEETQEEVESLREENSDLQEENESLQEEIEEVKGLYAESLAEATGLDADFFMDKGLDELKDLHEEKVDESPIETPSPKSGDPTPEDAGQGGVDDEKREEVLSRVNEQFENPSLSKYPRTSEVEGEDDLRQIISTYEGRGGIWEAAAEPYREALDELTA